MSNNLQIATLANGCFWCTEAIFQLLKGVKEVKSGYSGGDMANPDYETVCSGVTGHAECLNITFDPQIFLHAHTFKLERSICIATLVKLICLFIIQR